VLGFDFTPWSNTSAILQTPSTHEPGDMGCR